MGGEQEHLVAGGDEGARDRGQAAGGPRGDEHVLALGALTAAGAGSLDQGVEQGRHPLGGRVAVHARVFGNAEVLHPATLRGLHPGVANVQRIDLAAMRGEAVGERGIDRSRDIADGGGKAWISRHTEAPANALQNAKITPTEPSPWTRSPWES